MYRITLGSVHVAKEPIPPRHRRKRRDDDVLVTSTGAQATQTAATTTATNTTRETVNNSRGAQFDLEDSAFPPLPGKLKYKLTVFGRIKLDILFAKVFTAL